jgi:hypothetical protein
VILHYSSASPFYDCGNSLRAAPETRTPMWWSPSRFGNTSLVGRVPSAWFGEAIPGNFSAALTAEGVHRATLAEAGCEERQPS